MANSLTLISQQWRWKSGRDFRVRFESGRVRPQSTGGYNFNAMPNRAPRELREHAIKSQRPSVVARKRRYNIEEQVKLMNTFTDTVRAFLKKRKLGKYNPEEHERMMAKEEEKKKTDETAMENIKVGSRCQVEMPNNMARRGTVRYVGA